MDNKLLTEAKNIALAELDYSYAPYSKFNVGAAIITDNNKIYGGCNVENASYGLTNCAERTAIFKAVSEGNKEFKALVLTGRGPDFLTPCGACRQVIAEFCDPTMPIYMLKETGEVKEVTAGELLPLAFTNDDLN